MVSNNLYKRNFLTDVVFRIDFPFIKELESGVVNGKLDAFMKDGLQTTGSILENYIVTMNKEADSAPNTNYTTFKFSQYKSDDLVIEIAPNNIAIISKKYTDFPAFLKLIESVLEVFTEDYSLEKLDRLGLRYINKFDFEDRDSGIYDWDDYFDESLTSSLDFIENREDIRRSIQIYELKPSADISIVFKSGIFNSSYPNQLLEREFFIDIDGFMIGTESKNLSSNLQNLNDLITNYFKKSLTKKLEEKLNS